MVDTGKRLKIIRHLATGSPIAGEGGPPQPRNSPDKRRSMVGMQKRARDFFGVDLDLSSR